MGRGGGTVLSRRRSRRRPPLLRQALSVIVVAGLACLALLDLWWHIGISEEDGGFGTDAITSSVKTRRLEEGGISEYITDPLIDKPYKHADNRGWIVIHIIVIGYMLLGLNTVCDCYFTGALDAMVGAWHIKPDVAGATFMAAGGSAPELFTSLIGTTISESDVGFGTIVGSAVFNVLFVIGLCGFAATKPIKLTWWPLARDCTFYVVSLTTLAIFARTNYEIELWEACLLFIAYILYCIMMYFNTSLEALLHLQPPEDETDGTASIPPDSTPVPSGPPRKLTQVVPVGDTGSTGLSGNSPSDRMTGAASTTMTVAYSEDKQRHHIRQPQPHFHRPNNASNEEKAMRREASIPSASGARPASKTSPGALEAAAAKSETSCSTGNAPSGLGVGHSGIALAPVEMVAETQETTRLEGSSKEIADTEDPGATPTNDAAEEDDDDEDDDPDDIDALMEMPDAWFARVLWIMSLPIYVPLYYLLPKPTNSMFLVTFVLSLLWIAGFSFILVYCVEVFGEVLHIHIIVMGFTLLAAGTSIPDAVSSVAVARAGEGDMAVSSSIGSNIFDILVGLPIPWIIKIAFIEMAGKGRSHYAVEILSDYIVLYVLILVVMVLCVVMGIHVLGWVLARPLGAFMAVLYAIFLVTVLVVEFEQPEGLII